MEWRSQRGNEMTQCGPPIPSCLGMNVRRGGKIGLTRWASPIHPELGSGWAIKLLARKKPGQIWLGPVWPDMA